MPKGEKCQSDVLFDLFSAAGRGKKAKKSRRISMTRRLYLEKKL